MWLDPIYVTEQHNRCIDVMLHMCLFQRYDFILTIKVLRGQVSLGFNSNVSRYRRIGVTEWVHLLGSD